MGHSPATLTPAQRPGFLGTVFLIIKIVLQKSINKPISSLQEYVSQGYLKRSRIETEFLCSPKKHGLWGKRPPGGSGGRSADGLMGVSYGKDLATCELLWRMRVGQGMNVSIVAPLATCDSKGYQTNLWFINLVSTYLSTYYVRQRFKNETHFLPSKTLTCGHWDLSNHVDRNHVKPRQSGVDVSTV